MGRATLKKDTHGHVQCYRAGCRCEPCVKANTEAVFKARKKREARASGISPDDPRHGTQGFYINHGCRCARCTEAQAAGCARTRKRSKQGEQ